MKPSSESARDASVARPLECASNRAKMCFILAFRALGSWHYKEKKSPFRYRSDNYYSNNILRSVTCVQNNLLYSFHFVFLYTCRHQTPVSNVVLHPRWWRSLPSLLLLLPKARSHQRQLGWNDGVQIPAAFNEEVTHLIYR